MRIRAIMAAEHRRGLYAGRLENVGDTHACPFGATSAAIGPLIAARLRCEERAAIASAFHDHAPGHWLELRLEFAKREFKLLVHLPVDCDLPGVGVLGLFGNLPVVADVELVSRCRRVVEQAFRRFRHQRFLAEQDELVALAWEIEIDRTLFGRRGRGTRWWRRGCALRHRGWNQSARHVGRERNCATNRGAHRSEPGPAEKSSPVWPRFPPEYERIRPFGVLAIQFLDSAFPSSCHSVPHFHWPVGRTVVLFLGL